MSKFAQYLKELLEEHGEPIASVARNAGVERTSIHKALKDERVLPYGSLRKLSQYLQLPLVQSRELARRYEILLQGEDVYGIHTAVRELLHDMSRFEMPSPDGAPSRPAAGEGGEGSGIRRGALAVRSVVRAVLEREASRPDAQAFVRLPADVSLEDVLGSLWCTGAGIVVRRLVDFMPDRRGPEAVEHNLRVLRRLLPLSLVSRGRMFSYCQFGGDAPAQGVDPLPYLVVTSERLVRLDERLTVAQVECDRDLVDLYRARFEGTVAECQSLCSYSNDPGVVLDSYMSGTGEHGYCTIMSQPCPGRYYTRELIERYVRPDVPHREELVELSDRRFARLRALEGNYRTVFTEAGLRAFARDGVLVDLPRELVSPLDAKTRAGMLRRLKADMLSGSVTACVVDEAYLPIPQHLTFTCDPRFGLHVYATQEFVDGPYACNIHVEEGSIGKAFCSFVDSLPGSRHVYPEERVISIVDELVCGLENGSSPHAHEDRGF